MAERQPSTPTHRAYSVIKREGQDDYWLNLGLAFPHKDGGGFNIILQAFPLDGKIVCREIIISKWCIVIWVEHLEPSSWRKPHCSNRLRGMDPVIGCKMRLEGATNASFRHSTAKHTSTQD